MTEAGRPFLSGLLLLVAGLVLAALPGGLAGTAAGLILVLVLPGHAALTCCRIRTGSLSGLLFCVAASLAITPLALRLAGLVVPFDRAHVIGVLGTVTLGLLVVGASGPRVAAAPLPGRTPAAVTAILIATLLLLIPTLVIGPSPEGGETRVKGWDLNNHLAMAESIAARGLPPLNPFLQSDAPFYYHTFFHILVGAVLVMAGEGGHAYLIISIVTVLLALVFLSTFHRVVSELTGDDRVALWSLPLVSLVGGFDLIPMAGRFLLQPDGAGSAARFFLRHWNVDGWVSNRGMLVPSLFASFYWVPHAVAAMVVFLLALRFLRGPGTGPAALALSGACLASLAGYNGYVALGGAAILVMLGVADFRIGRERFLRNVLVAGLGLLLALPVLRLYIGNETDVDKFRWARPGPLVPLQLVLEFGPALLLGLTGLIAARRDPCHKGSLIPFGLMSVVSLPAICLLASTGENNDLAMRLSMFLWIGLAVFSGIALSRLFPLHPVARPTGALTRMVALTALGLGFLSVAWFAMGAALDKPTLPPDEVAAGRWIRSHVLPGRLVQGSPLRGNPDLVYLSGHPAILSDTWAGRLFYANPDDYARQMAALGEAFSTSDPAAACAMLRSLGVEVLVVGPPERRDFPLLARAESWPCLFLAYRRESYGVYRLTPP